MSLIQLMTVEVRVLIKNRGLAVTPGPLAEEWCGAGGQYDFEWRSPDGRRGNVIALVSSMFVVGIPLEIRLGVILKDVDEDDIPVGTEIWCDQGLTRDCPQAGES